ncbi:hypothetical protein [Mycoplasma suis]|uniref:Uncharacterized protein n=2 Tax=Mycoplasma suis TaxID=57372 RepID=F0QQC3_MYCSL|nr:hypothetical protein [Mycoplasma suis]ADX97693.1 hypothetical protein MSU_0149 [Mycoplasma suis str. Illinois]CBZ40233.1 hypothetical protein MSUIS_01400 [Mycoplasma suis KI3806]
MLPLTKVLVTMISAGGVVGGGYGISYFFGNEVINVVEKIKPYLETRRLKTLDTLSRGDVKNTITPIIQPQAKREKEFSAEEIYKNGDGSSVCKNLTLQGNSEILDQLEVEQCNQRIRELWNDSQKQPKLWIRAKEEDAVNKALKHYNIKLENTSVMNQGWTCQKFRDESEQTIIINCEQGARREESEDVN